MPKVNITFYRCIQDSQEYGSDDEHMVSRVFFRLKVNGREFPDLHSDIKQTVGSDYKTGPIEVERPAGYEGPLNYNAFRNAVEKYYRSLVGAGGSDINIQGGTNIRMYGNIFNKMKTIEFEADEVRAGW